MHDSVLQNLGFALRILSNDENKHKKNSVAAVDLIRRAKAEVRGLSQALHPSVLLDLGLHSAIEGFCYDFQRRSSVKVQFSFEGCAFELSHDQNLGVFRIIQESFRNIEKHSGAKQARLRVIYERASLSVEVIDDGIGFNVGQSVRGFAKSSNFLSGLGLVYMRERAHALGGSLSLDSCSGRGTRVYLSLPTSPVGTDVKMGGFYGSNFTCG